MIYPNIFQSFATRIFPEKLKVSIHKMDFKLECSSIAHAVINLIDSIENVLDKNKFACGVFIDLKKAFSTVDHEIFLKKLWHF